MCCTSVKLFLKTQNSQNQTKLSLLVSKQEGSWSSWHRQCWWLSSELFTIPDKSILPRKETSRTSPLVSQCKSNKGMSCNSQQQQQASLGEPTSSVVDSSSPEKEQELIVNTIEQWSSQSHALESPSYISSASSTTGATTPFTHQTIPMDTINHNIPTRKNSDDFMNMPPVHPFFNQPFVYDSDGSDGR